MAKKQARKAAPKPRPAAPAHELEYVPERGPSTALALRPNVADAEIVSISDPVNLRATAFTGAGIRPLPKAAIEILCAPIDEQREVAIKPTGELYMPHVFYRQRLIKAVGPMGWAMQPLTETNAKDAHNQMFREYKLIVLGRVVSVAMGSSQYFENNARMDFSDTAEACKSEALKRCCKDLGIGWELWDHQWCETWKEKHTVHVHVKVKKWIKGRDGERGHYEDVEDTHWRRIDSKPFKGEYGIVKDSPNQERWRKQWDGWATMLEKDVAAAKTTIAHVRAARAAAKEANITTRGGSGEAAEPTAPEHEDDDNTSEPRSSSDAAKPEQRQRLDRRYYIRECKTLKREPTFILYGITMMDGKLYTTFSSTIFQKAQLAMAAGDAIEMVSEEKVHKGKTYSYIIEWTVVQKGAVIE